MFKAFEYLETKTDEKQIISYFEEAIKHLTILQSYNFSSERPLEVILNELGFLENENSLQDFLKFVQKKIKTPIEQLSTLFALIQHDDSVCLLPKICKKCRLSLLENEKISNKPTVIDLFCGSGGMSLGFTQSGYKIIFANDIEPSCVETYSYNHPEVNPEKVILGDIQDFASTVSEYTMNEHVDVVIGGPPCQSFSNANRQRIIDDPRNRLYKEFVAVVASVRPTFFVMENVIGMKQIANQVCEDFERIGYKVNYEVLNAVEFGVPQQRKRVIFIGNKVGFDNEKIFKNIHQNNATIQNTTLEDAIADLPTLTALNKKNATEYESDEHGHFITSFNNYKQNNYLKKINGNNIPKYLYNHKARYNNERDIEIFSRLHQGDKSDDPKIVDIMPYASRNDIFKDKYYKLIYAQPCKTITAHMKFDCNMYIHPTQARGLTPREAARVQSYPDDYFFKGSYTKTYMQVGNSVPPLMARGIAQVVKNYLDLAQLEDEQLKFSI